VKAEREAIGWMLPPKRPALPAVITLTRIAPSQGLDDDNLQGSLKGCRDAVAAWLSVDDRDPRIEWRYAQERGAWAVRVEVA
jgi:hypothetical protein